jgi:lipoprotein signal peptidase
MEFKAQTIIFAALVIELFDIIFKYLAVTRLTDTGRVSFPIGLALHKNPGIAFDLEVPLGLILVLTTIVVGLLVRYAHRLWVAAPINAAAAIVVTIGALGNALDRLINGFTTDYLIFFSLSAINLSDILILAGVASLLWYNDSKLKVN